MKKYSLIIVSVIALTLLATFIARNNATPANTSPITLGTIMSETGIAAAFGENAKDGAMLAVEEINKNGGINGRTVVLITEDDRTDPKTALGLYKKLTSVDHVDAIIGSNFDFVVNPLFAEAKNGNTVIITPTSPRIPGALDTNKNSFSMLSDFGDIVATLDTLLTKTPYKKIAVIHYNGAFGEQITTTIHAISVKNGKGGAIEEVYNEFGITDWTPYILKMKRDGVDIVFADMLGGDYARFVTQAKRLGWNPQFMTHMDVREALNDSKLYTPALEGTIVLNWDALGDDASFSQKFKARYGRGADHFAAQSYVATYAAAQAVEKAGSDATKISQILGNSTFTTPLGEFSFTAHHTAAKTKVKIQEIKNKQLVDLETF